ncbi:MAG: serine--tRNA ligase, partial [Aphanizomenon sp.]
MLDIKQIRENPQLIQEKLNTRSGKYEIQPILDLSQEQRELEVKRNELQARSNEIGKLVGHMVNSVISHKNQEIQALMDE